MGDGKVMQVNSRRESEEEPAAAAEVELGPSALSHGSRVASVTELLLTGIMDSRR